MKSKWRSALLIGFCLLLGWAGITLGIGFARYQAVSKAMKYHSAIMENYYGGILAIADKEGEAHLDLLKAMEDLRTVTEHAHKRLLAVNLEKCPKRFRDAFEGCTERMGLVLETFPVDGHELDPEQYRLRTTQLKESNRYLWAEAKKFGVRDKNRVN